MYLIIIYKIIVKFWKPYSLSNSNDLIEYNGDFGSRLCTSMSCLDVMRPVRTIFCNNDFSDAGNSLSSSLEVLLWVSAVGSFEFLLFKCVLENCVGTLIYYKIRYRRFT